MKKTKFLLLLLCFCMILPLLVACEKGGDDSTDTGEKYKYDDLTRETARDSIPDDYSLEGGTVSIAYRGNADGAIGKSVIGLKESTDIVYSKIYERNLSVSERLHADIQFLSIDTSDIPSTVDAIRREIQTMSGVWDVIIPSCNTSVGSLYNYFHNINDSNYIDINERWWYTDAINELSVDNYNYRFLFGDINICTYGLAGSIFYNKNLYSQYIEHEKPDALYQLVLDGKWTFEQLATITKKSHIEKGGDGSNDIYGYSPVNYQDVFWLKEAAGFKGYERDEMGMPKFNLYSDKAASFAEMLYDFYYENEGVNLTRDAIECFANGYSMFHLRNLNQLLEDYMRNMKDDFGVLPYPKLDEEQEEYITMIHDSSTVVVFPVSADIDRVNEEVSAVVEALASESYRSVYTAYYESALKAAYNRDDLSAQMIDIITGQHATVKSSITKNFVHEFNSSLGEYDSVFYKLVTARSKDFASTHDSIISVAEQGLKALIKNYKDGKI